MLVAAMFALAYSPDERDGTKSASQLGLYLMCLSLRVFTDGLLITPLNEAFLPQRTPCGVPRLSLALTRSDHRGAQTTSASLTKASKSLNCFHKSH